ncbi:MAG: L-serine ammonia-lyase, iron-sulfur-dependent, subunit alpha [Candidatus Shapirobacteria bacterium]|jgi:L-cysteine desulfidase
MNSELCEILKSEVKPALGCTGPISAAFAASAAKSVIGGTPLHISILVDKDTYKNSISVATPGTPFWGTKNPTVLGAFYGKPELGLEVIRDAHDADFTTIEAFARDHCDLDIKWDMKSLGIHIDVRVDTEQGYGRAIVANEHDRIVLLETNGRIIRREENLSQEISEFERKRPIRSHTMKELYEFSRNVDLGEIQFLKEVLDCNLALARYGLDTKAGAGFGLAILELKGYAPYLRAKALAAAASDARMSGAPLPAMSCAGSGNVGISASVPLSAIAEGHGISEEGLLRALAFSYLLTILGKAHIGRLSPICACAMAASIGIGAGTCMMLGGSFEQVEYTIANIVGSTGGVLCDGAKFGCAYKLASAIGLAIESAELALMNVHIPALDGIVCASGDQTLAMLGRIASVGMLGADEYMSRELIGRETMVDSSNI